MILWSSKIEQEKEVTVSNMGIRSWRTVFKIDKWSIGFERQIMYQYADWHDINGAYKILYLNSNFFLGLWRYYYDGCHNTYSLGWLQFAWSSDNCTADDCVHMRDDRVV